MYGRKGRIGEKCTYAALQEVELQHSLYNEGKSDFTLDSVLRITVVLVKRHQAGRGDVRGGGGRAGARLV